MQKISRRYHLIDARGKVLGRLAVEIAGILSGRNRVDYAPYIDAGDFVVIINTDKIEVTGTKEKSKEYHRHTGFPGGLKTERLEQVREKDSRKIIERAVYGMLPKNKLRDKMMKRLRLYKDENHSHTTIHVTHA